MESTWAGFKLPHGCCNVASSHKMTPKLYTSDFSLDGSSRRTSGAIHSGWYIKVSYYLTSTGKNNYVGPRRKLSCSACFSYKQTELTVPAADFDERNVLAFNRERPKSQTWNFKTNWRVRYRMFWWFLRRQLETAAFLSFSRLTSFCNVPKMI